MKKLAIFVLLICSILIFNILNDNSNYQISLNQEIAAPNLGTIYNFGYTGNVQSFTAPVSGFYKIELWGAQGGNNGSLLGGRGAYTAGVVELIKGQTIFIQVGGQGKLAGSASVTAGYNGGQEARAYSGATYGAGSGGATDVRLVGGEWNNATSLRSRIMVAGAGSGLSNWQSPISNAAPAGGLIGYPGRSVSHSGDPLTNATGATQTAGGTRSCGLKCGSSGTFGIGGAAESGHGSGGGGGYYGGGGGAYNHGHVGSGSGGSSYISGHTGSVAITSATNQAPKSGCTTGTTNNNCSIHYSGMTFTETVMIDGFGYKWTNTKGGYLRMPTTSGGLNANGVGHSGNGYAKITYEEEVIDPMLNSITVNGESISLTGGIFSYSLNLDTMVKEAVITASAPTGQQIVGQTTISVKPNSHKHTLSVTNSTGRTQLYEINLIREPSSTTILDGIKINDTLYSEFDSNIFEYNITMPYDTEEIKLDVLKNMPYQGVTINGFEDTIFQFDEQSMMFVILVVAEDNSGTNIYTFNFEKERTTKLKNITLSDPNIDFAFSSSTANYTLDVSNLLYALDVTTEPYLKEAIITVEGNKYFEHTDIITITSSIEGLDTSVYKLKINKEVLKIDPFNFGFTGSVQTFTAPYDSLYKIELWGAQGGNNGSLLGGRGAYTAGTVALNKDQTLYIQVGGQGKLSGTVSNNQTGGYNGGGEGRPYNGQTYGAGSGGATDIRLVGGTWNDATSLRSRIMVAGAGSGISNWMYPVSNASPGGGLVGYNGREYRSWSNYYANATGGTQTAGGNAGCGYRCATNGSFGIGGMPEYSHGSGGGGGYYGGGGGSYNSSVVGSGGGGSSYISGHTGSVAITSATNQAPKAGCTTGTTNNGCSVHYSGLKFSNTSMIDGYAYHWSNVRGGRSQMPNTTGSLYPYGTGHSGNGYAKITVIESNNNNYLDNIILNDGSVEIDFEPWVLEYDIHLTEHQTELDIEALTKDNEAYVVGTGLKEVTAESQVYELIVTASNGQIRTYTFNVTREISSNPFPEDIIINKMYEYICGIEYCDYTFDKNTNSYIINIPSNLMHVEFDIVKAQKYQEVVLKKHQNDEFITLTDYQVTMEDTINNFQIEITAEDGLNKSTYSYSFIVDQNSNNKLATLDIVNPVIDFTFNPDVHAYHLTIDSAYNSFDVIATPQASNATVEVSGNTNLKIGMNVSFVKVTSFDGTKRTYVLYVYKANDTNVFLKDLNISNYDEIFETEETYNLSPMFDKTFNEYTLNLPSHVNTIDIVATPESEYSVVTIDKPDVIKSGNTKITITVTGGNGISNVYIINVLKDKNNDTRLKTLTVENYPFEFNSGVYEYDLTVNKHLPNLNITATTVAETTNYKILNNNLNETETKILIETTAENGAVGLYTLNITKEISDNNELFSITSSKGVINETIDNSLTTYTMNVSNDIDIIDIEIMPVDNDSKVVGNGNYSLKVGENTINFKIVSETGIEKDYTLIITRGVSTDNSILKIENNKNSEVSKIDDSTYVINVQNEVDEIEIIATPTSRKATVTGNGKYSLITGENNINIKVTSESGEERDYVVNVIRDLSVNDDLDFLFAKEAALNPTFKDTTIHYQLRVPNSVESLTLTIEPEDKNATYEVIGNSNFVTGYNEVVIRVTAEDLIHTKDYTLNVYKENPHLSDLTLFDLSVSEGVLEPQFDSLIRDYYVTVENEITEIAIEGILNDESMRIIGNGTYSLKEGKNVLVVTALDENNNLLDYQVVVTRKLSSDASLKSVVIKSHNLNPSFRTDVTDYYLTTSETDLDFVIIEPTEEKSTYEVTGNEVLTTGDNLIEITVTAPDLVTTKTYKINVTKEASDNNNLSDIITDYEYSPVFYKTTTFYTMNVLNDVNSIAVEGIAEEQSAVVSGNGIHELEVGRNIIQLLVTSESGNSKSYVIIVTKEGSNNNDLEKLYTDIGPLTPVFDKDILNYELIVDYEIDTTFVYASSSDSNAKVSGVGEYDLIVGENKISVVVTAENGDVKTYQVNITRNELNSALLTELKAADYPFDTDFNKNIFDYNIEVNNETTSLDLMYELEDPNGFVQVIGNEEFKEGLNTVEIKVLASDFVTEQTYTITVYRKMYTDNLLNNLEVTNHLMEPMFNPEILEYTINIENEVSMVDIITETMNPNATVSGDGTVEIFEKEKTIEVIVTSPIGIKRSYFIYVNKIISDNNYLSSLQIRDLNKQFDLNPKFVKNKNDYQITVEPDVTDVILFGVADDPKSTVVGLESYNLEVGNNKLSVAVTSESGLVNVYNLGVDKIASTNNNVINIIPSFGNINFEPETKTYELILPDDASVLEFEVILEDTSAVVTGHEQVGILNGTSTRLITITAEDGSVNEYTFNISKEVSDVLLKELKIENYNIDFEPTVFEYNLAVSSSKNMLLESEITAIANDLAATVNLMGDINLPNSYIIEVIGVDNYTVQEYKINISNDNDALALKSDIYTINNDYVIVENIPVTEIIENFYNSEHIKIYKNDALYTGIVGTNMKVKLVVDDIIYDEVTLIVLGDLNGDSKINVLDKIEFSNHINKTKLLIDGYILAGDVNKDNYTNSEDLNLIDKTIIKSE